MHRFDRVGPAPARPIAIGRRVEIRLEDRLQHQLGGGLHHPVPDRRGCRGAARHRRAWGSSPVAPALADTSSQPGPSRCRRAIHRALPPRSARTSCRPRPARPCSHGPAHRRPECRRGRSCRRAGRSGTPAPPSPCDTALKGPDLLGVARLIANHRSSPSSKARQKSGPFLRRRYPASAVP